MTWTLKIGLAAAVIYVAVLAILYFAQTKLLFPAGLAGGRIDLPETAERLHIETPDGVRLEGVRLLAAQTAEVPLTLLLFGGNAWNAEEGAHLFHQLIPEADIVAFHYRGYGPSGGTPSTAAILEDALRIHDAVSKGPEHRIVAVGLSLGAGPAAYLAANRPLAGLILATPFDSLTKLAKHHYFWAPVKLMLRHRLPVADFVRRIDASTAVILAGRDRVVPAARSAAVLDAASNLVLHRTIAGAGHNDLYDRPEFATALREAVRSVLEKADD